MNIATTASYVCLSDCRPWNYCLITESTNDSATCALPIQSRSAHRKHSKAVHRVEEEKFRFPLNETEIEISILPPVHPRQSLCLTPLWSLYYYILLYIANWGALLLCIGMWYVLPPSIHMCHLNWVVCLERWMDRLGACWMALIYKVFVVWLNKSHYVTFPVWVVSWVDEEWNGEVIL